MPRRRGPNPRTDKNAFKRLKALPFFEEIDRKIKANVSVDVIADWIQKDRLQLLDIKRESLIRQLFRYKAALPPGEIAEVEPLFFAKAIEKLKRGIDELEELEKLYLLQVWRLSIDVKTESKINKLFSGTVHEIRLAADLLARLTEKKMQLGLLTREPTKVAVSGNIGVLPLVDAGELDEDTRARLGLVAGKVLEVMDKAMRTAAPVEDGDDERS